LAQNKQAVYFQYDSAYLTGYHSLSPFSLPFSNELAQTPIHPHQGLHGVFSDSLPDGWGLLLIGVILFQNNLIKPINKIKRYWNKYFCSLMKYIFAPRAGAPTVKDIWQSPILKYP